MCLSSRKERDCVMDIRKRALELNDYAVEIRRELHAHPELSYDLPFTEGVVVRELTKLGLTPRGGMAGGHGVCADIRGERPGLTLAMRADMDALPIREETGLPFAATNGCMHACGHDVHTAMLLTAARLLCEARAELPGTVRLIFQPAEETADGGAAKMVQEGAMEGVERIVGLHTGNLWKGLKPGQIGWRVGAFMASTTTFDVTLRGKSAHGATPHLSVDTIAMAARIICSLQTIVSREMSPFDPAVLTVGKIEGGAAPNVVSDTCRFMGMIRCFSAENSEFMKERIRATVEAEAAAMRGEGSVAFMNDLLPVINDETTVRQMCDAISEALGPEFVQEVEGPTTGAEDFSEYTRCVPGAFFYHCSTLGDGQDYPHHNPHFVVNESVLWTGAAAMAAFALKQKA